MWISLGISSSSDCIDSSDAYIFRNTALICLGAGGVASLVFHLTVKGRLSQNKDLSPLSSKSDGTENDKGVGANDNSRISIPGVTETHRRKRMTIKDWLHEPQFYSIGFLYMFTRLFVNSTQVFIPFYLQITLQLRALYVAVIPLVMYLSGLPSAFITKFITKWIGKKVTYGIACVIGGCGSIWVHWGKQYLQTYSYNSIINSISSKKIFSCSCVFFIT